MYTLFSPQSSLAQTETSFPRHLPLTLTVITVNTEIKYRLQTP